MPPRVKPFVCGFCANRDHGRCRRASRGGVAGMLICTCVACQDKSLKCLECGGESDVDPTTFTCTDPLHCAGVTARRLSESPLYQQLRDCQEIGRRERERAREALARRL